MTREEEIKQKALKLYPVKEQENKKATGTYDANLPRRKVFEEGAKWSDENPDKNLVYTKQELMNMGFGFDLNGNISTPQEIEERSKKYINYRKSKWIKEACEWLKHQEEMIGVSFEEDFIERFKKDMEE